MGVKKLPYGAHLEQLHQRRITARLLIRTTYDLQPLDKSAVSRLESALKSSSIAGSAGGKSLKIIQKVNPSIQGGLIVDFGDSSIDLSVANRVNKLNQMLNQGV